MVGPQPNGDVFETYWYFAAERQRILDLRLRGEPAPWSEDEILRSYRFCNSFRASDRVSQALIAAAYAAEDFSAEDLVLRIVLFRLFSKPSTWALLEREHGMLRAESFDEQALGLTLDRAFKRGDRLYTGAFILCATPAFGHARKHRNHLALLAAMLREGLPARIEAAASLREVYELLAEWPLIGPFMAYQLAIDLNYSPLLDFDEDDFTVPGPGAVRGLAKVFSDLGELSPSDAVHWLVDYQGRVGTELGIEPPTLLGRPLHAIDCQNLLCEVDKYCRVAYPQLRSNRTRIKQRFSADPTPLPCFYPPKWGLPLALAA